MTLCTRVAPSPARIALTMRFAGDAAFDVPFERRVDDDVMLDAVADERSERGIVGRLRQKNPGGDARFVIRERSVGRELDVQRDAVNVFRVAEKSRGETRGAVL